MRTPAGRAAVTAVMGRDSVGLRENLRHKKRQEVGGVFDLLGDEEAGGVAALGW